jgi:calcineurin-like phosphoesterase family protein
VEDKLTHIEVMGDIQVVLCHYAMRVWRNAHHGALHFYGHSHGNLPGDAQSLDVGVDCWDFAPASFRPRCGSWTSASGSSPTTTSRNRR